MPERRLATGEPQVSNRRHRARDLCDLRAGHVARMIELFMIKAGATERVAARGHKQDQRPEAPFALGRANQLDEL